MTGWLTLDLGESVKLFDEEGRGYLHSYYEFPHGILAIRIECPISTNTERVVVCVSCLHVEMDTRFRFSEMYCSRETPDTLRVTCDGTVAVDCSSVRVFSGNEFEHWIGKSNSTGNV